MVCFLSSSNVVCKLILADMQIVALDGETTNPAPAKTVVVGAAMRYDVLITGKPNATTNFDIAALIDTGMFRGTYSGNPVGTAQLVYNPTYPKAAPRTPPVIQQTSFPPTDDLTAKPADGQALLGPVTKQVILDFGFTQINGIHRAVINNITYLSPKVPSLYTALSVGKANSMNPIVYGKNVNPIPVKFGDVVEVVLNNHDVRGHPWYVLMSFYVESITNISKASSRPQVPSGRSICIQRRHQRAAL